MSQQRVDQDPLEDLAIQRRRNYEAERKKRIFDPVLSKQAVIVDAIRNQLEENRVKRQQLKDEAERYDQNSKTLSSIMAKVEQADREARRLEQERVTATNAVLAKQHHERAKNDPLKPINQHPPCDENSTGSCGVSSAQVMDGEDWTHAERLEKQKHQRQLWHMQAMQEKAQIAFQKFQAEQAEVEYVKRVDAHVLQMNAQDRRRNEQERMHMYEHNAVLAEEKRIKDIPNKEAVQTSLLTQALADVSLDRPHLVWKFMSEEQRAQVLRDEAQTIENAKQRRAKAQQEKEQAFEYQQALSAITKKMDADEAAQTSGRIKEVTAENVQKSGEFRQRNARMNQEYRYNVPTELYFSQFNTTSR